MTILPQFLSTDHHNGSNNSMGIYDFWQTLAQEHKLGSCLIVNQGLMQGRELLKIQ